MNRGHMTKEAKRAAKTEKKLKILTGGYQVLVKIQFITTPSQEENILFSSLSEPCRRSDQAADGRRGATWANQAGVGDIQPIEGRFLCQGLMKIKIIILMVLWYVMAPFCDSPPFIFLDFWVNSNPTATGNFDCGCSSTTREGEELTRGLQVNSPYDFQILLNLKVAERLVFVVFSPIWCYRSMQHSLEEARLGSFPEREEDAEGGEA